MVKQSEANQLVANKSNKIVSVFDFFENQRSLIKKALPSTITTDRLIGIFTMIIKSSPQLTQCTQQSLIGAVIQTVQLGLQPGNIGHVYLVPFNNKRGNKWIREVQLIVGYKGLCELVNRSGQAVVLNAEAVRENDELEYELGLNPKLKHVPAQGERGDIIGSYAIAKLLRANEKVFVYLDKTQIDKVHSASKAKDSDFSPWNSWPEEMCKKTAVKRLCKLLPLSTDVQQQIGADETIKTTIDADMTQVKDEANWDEDKETENPNVEEPTATDKDVKNVEIAEEWEK